MDWLLCSSVDRQNGAKGLISPPKAHSTGFGLKQSKHINPFKPFSTYQGGVGPPKRVRRPPPTREREPQSVFGPVFLSGLKISNCRRRSRGLSRCTAAPWIQHNALTNQHMTHHRMADDTSHTSGGAASASSASASKRRRSSSQGSAGGPKRLRQGVLTASGGVKQLLKTDRTAMEIGALIKDHNRKWRWVGLGLIWCWWVGCGWAAIDQHQHPFPAHPNHTHSASPQGGPAQADQV